MGEMNPLLELSALFIELVRLQNDHSSRKGVARDIERIKLSIQLLLLDTDLMLHFDEEYGYWQIVDIG